MPVGLSQQIRGVCHLKEFSPYSIKNGVVVFNAHSLVSDLSLHFAKIYFNVR